MSLKCLIVDDEPLAVEILQSYVERIESLELIAACNNAVQAFDVLKKEKIDLLFLDIQMPKLTGIEFLKALNPAPKVIFTTAYREYAVESYELNVTDYLLKPIAFDRFMMAINKVMKNGDTSSDIIQSTALDLPEEKGPFLFLKVDRKMVKVFLKDITFIESLKDYVRVKTEKGKELVSLQKISYLEKKLPSDCFIRVHKFYIVSVKKISTYSSSIIEVGTTGIPIGRSYKSEVMRVLSGQA